MELLIITETGTRPFLKWAGNKFKIVKDITDRLPPGQRLIEPFVGSGAVFLNTNYKHYILGDVNKDLIDLYQILQKEGSAFIKATEKLFTPANNTAEAFYKLRTQFNTTRSKRKKAMLFVYLNRHCYNGLCRYNKSGHFNVPFGRYRAPYFPAREMHLFYERSKKATFICQSFEEILLQAKKKDVIYCDPPYIPLSPTANFTNYSGQHFLWSEQEQLALIAKTVAARGGAVLISNHDTPESRVLYKEAKIYSLSVKRNISCRIQDRGFVPEVLALYL